MAATADTWTARGAVATWPRSRPLRRGRLRWSAAPIWLASPSRLADGIHQVAAMAQRWWTRDLDDEGRDMTLLGAMMGLVAMAMVAATAWASALPASQPFERALERQHAEWVQQQQQLEQQQDQQPELVATLVGDGLTTP